MDAGFVQARYIWPDLETLVPICEKQDRRIAGKYDVPVQNLLAIPPGNDGWLRFTV